jgi:hypothetical protein
MLRVLNPSVPIESQRPTVVLGRPARRLTDFDAARLQEVVQRLEAYVDACLLTEPPAMDPWLTDDELELRLEAI